MLAGAHVVFGAGLYLLTSPYTGFDYPEVYYFLPFAILGSLMPDLDSRRSALKRSGFSRCVLLPLTLLGHRTWSHSLLILFLLSLPLMHLEGMQKMAMLAFNIGYVSHILGDWLTHRGVPLFYPARTAFKSPLPFKTGSAIEMPVAMIPFLIMAGFYLFESHHGLLQFWH
ncbi:inner membrane protein [uncultured Thiomicrorhabdus sp.]